jgi:hypothetical protein
MPNTRRFAVVLTNDPTMRRWQVHRADCPDVAKLISKGGFADYASAVSASALLRSELISQTKYVTAGYDIMPCCDEAATAG